MSNNHLLNGILPINKDAGMTSHDVVAKIRRILGIKKVGHTGTLDPEVTGVLPICIGKATRLSEYIMEMPKTYKGQTSLGISTSTQDFTGEITQEEKAINITEREIRAVFQSFIGEIEQIPPMYSSVKINGKKLYELARQGKEIERKPKKVRIYDLIIEKIDFESENPKIDFNVTCSKGTYVRTLCFDIGQKLGYPAHMSKLVRTKSGSFKLENSYTLEEIEQHTNSDTIEGILVSMADSLPLHEEVVLSEDDIKNKVYNGQIIHLNSLETYNGIIKVVNTKGLLVALYEKDKGSLKARPNKVFK